MLLLRRSSRKKAERVNPSSFGGGEKEVKLSDLRKITRREGGDEEGDGEGGLREEEIAEERLADN